MRFGQWFKRTYGYPGKDSSFTSKQIGEEEAKIRKKHAENEKAKDNDLVMSTEQRKAKVKAFLDSNKMKK